MSEEFLDISCNDFIVLWSESIFSELKYFAYVKLFCFNVLVIKSIFSSNSFSFSLYLSETWINIAGFIFTKPGSFLRSIYSFLISLNLFIAISSNLILSILLDSSNSSPKFFLISFFNKWILSLSKSFSVIITCSYFPLGVAVIFTIKEAASWIFFSNLIFSSFDLIIASS